MKITEALDSCKRQAGLLLMVVILFLAVAERVTAQQRVDSAEVPIRIVSAQSTRFDKPIKIGPPKRAIEYREAVVLTLEVDRDAFDSLPPSMEPFLYIGRNEYHIFAVDRQDNRRTLLLTFHIRNWTQLRDNSPMVLTIDHDAPIRNPQRFERQQGPRLNKTIISARPQ